MIKFPRPIHENVIVLQDEKPKEPESGGFQIPDELSEKPKRGTVMAASQGYHAKDTGVFIPLDVKKGDRVIFSHFAGGKIVVEGVDYILMKQSDISAIL